MSTLVQVETASARLAVGRILAKQNALLGLKQGLGELQRSVGPDQRVSVSAAMFDADPRTERIEGVENPHYTGVFAAHSTNEALEVFRATQDEPDEAITWLVSSAQAIINPVEHAIEDFSAATVVIANTYDAAQGKVDSIYAGKVPVGERGSHFAWWVADEGQKAKLTTMDPGIGNTNSDRTLDVDMQAKLSVMQARQSNFAHVSAGFDTPFSDLVLGNQLAKLDGLQRGALLSKDWGDWLYPTDPQNSSLKADVNPLVTLHSYGIPVDVTQGRLKEDLTVYLETGFGLSDDEHIVRGSDKDDEYQGPAFGADLTTDSATDNMPRFGILKSWNALGKTYSSARDQPQTNEQHGLHPIVARAGFSLSIARVRIPIYGPDPDNPGQQRLLRYEDVIEDPNNPANMIVGVQPLIFVRAALWNPYNFTLPAAEYLFEISLPDHLYLEWKTSESRPSLTADPRTSDNWAQGHYYKFTITGDGVESPMIQPDSYNWKGDTSWLRMIIDTSDASDGQGNPGMPAGEMLNFSPEAVQNLFVDARYVDMRASEYRTSTRVNRAMLGYDNLNNLEHIFLLGPVHQVSVPKQHVWFRSVPEEPPTWYHLRSQMDTGNDLKYAVSWRLSLLKESAEPALLCTKDPTKTTKAKMITPSGFDRESHGNGWSKNWNGVKRLDPLLTSHTHQIHTGMHDYWRAAARGGGARQGGDRRNSVRNPRGGILRENQDLSNWGQEAHRISVYTHDPYEAYWVPARWRRESNLQTGHEGTVEGYVRQSIDNAAGYKTGTRYTMFDLPSRFGPITSIGQFQHANLNPFGFGSSYQVGFSRAPYHVDREALVMSANTSLKNERIDLPYMLNASLWDRFYLSTIPQIEDFSLSLSQLPVLANNRHVLVPDADGSFPDLTKLRHSETAFTHSAEHIQVDGAFNINSVSVDAWEAVLLQAAGKEIITVLNGSLNDVQDASFVAFPRFPDPVSGAKDNAMYDSFDAQVSEQHTGIFVTSPEDIRILAETIVAEIKRRGPFLSLADFINRRQIPDADNLDIDYLGLMGTLDAAIMRASQQDKVLNNSQISSLTGDWNQRLDPMRPEEASVYAVDVENALGIPRGHFSTALEGSSSNLTQADILQMLGPQLAARSDTFLIRSYGEAVDSISGKVHSIARCEALVQRVAEPCETNDSVIAPVGDFGRRFVVLAFRWLQDGSYRWR